jgi:hypothetical protein
MMYCSPSWNDSIYSMQHCVECAQRDLQSEYWSHMLKSDYYITLMVLALSYCKLVIQAYSQPLSNIFFQSCNAVEYQIIALSDPRSNI